MAKKGSMRGFGGITNQIHNSSKPSDSAKNYGQNTDEEAEAKADEEAKLKAEQEAEAKADEEAKLKAEQEAKAKADEEAKLKAEHDKQKDGIKTPRKRKKKSYEECLQKNDKLRKSGTPVSIRIFLGNHRRFTDLSTDEKVYIETIINNILDSWWTEYEEFIKRAIESRTPTQDTGQSSSHYAGFLQENPELKNSGEPKSVRAFKLNHRRFEVLSSAEKVDMDIITNNILNQWWSDNEEKCNSAKNRTLEGLF